MKPFLELQTGDDFYRKTGEWNRREKIEDRENDRYYEHIVNPKTGEIVHHCEEPLSQHRGHGAARKKNTRTAQIFEISARRWEKRTGVWQAWRNWALALREDTYALYLASRDPRVPRLAKLVVVLVVAYALSPIDLIPDFIPVLGYLDDMLLLPMGIALAIKLMPRDVWEDCKSQARAELASELPRNRTAAIVIATVWLALLGLVAWLAWPV